MGLAGIWAELKGTMRTFKEVQQLKKKGLGAKRTLKGTSQPYVYTMDETIILHRVWLS